jgi:hypothetical protein
MFINKGKERAPSLTGNIIITTTVPTVLTKDTFPKIKPSDTFSGDRKKFKIYELQSRMYLWADKKKGDWRNLKTISKQTLFLALRLRSETFDRLESYIIQILEKGYIRSEDKVRKIFNNTVTIPPQ